MGLTLGETLSWAARYLPNKAAIVVNEQGQPRQTWTYAQLDAQVNRHAHALLGLGIGYGDVVAAFLYNTPTYVFTMMAAARIGAVFNPINYRLAAQELAFILEDGKAKALLFETEGADVVQRARALTSNTAHWVYADPAPSANCATAHLELLLRDQPSTAPDVQVHPEDACILMYTSGTTGRPKGVVHTHANKLAHNAMMHQVMHYSREDVGLSIAPLNHTAELHTSFMPKLQVGATQVLQRKFDADDALRLVEEEGVNEKMAEFINPIAMLGDQMTKFTTEIGFKGMQNPDEVGAASVDYLRVAGHLVFGYLFARMAQVALRQIAAGNSDPYYLGKLQTARFYFAKLFPETVTLMRTARAGSKVLMDTDAALN